MTVMQVYQKTLARAQEAREYCKNQGNPADLEPEEREDYYIEDAIATALYGVCADLEFTEEVNPTK